MSKPTIPKVGARVRTGEGREGVVVKIEKTTGQPRAWVIIDKLQRRKARKLMMIS